jgi:MFS family permease
MLRVEVLGFFERHAARFRSALSGIAATAVIYPAAFFVALGEGTLSLGLIFLMRDSYAAAPSLIGGLMGSGTLVYVAGCLFVRPLFASLRSRYLLLLATGGMAASIGLLFGLRSVPATFVFYSLSRLSASLFWPPAMGWLTQKTEGKNLSRILSRFNMSWSIGVMISPMLSGRLSELDPEYPVLATTAMLVIAFLLIGGAALAVPAVRRDRSTGRRQAAEAGGRDRSTPLRFTGWVGLCACYVAAGVIVTVFPQFARDSLGASPSVVGNILSLRMLARTAGFVALGALSFWHHHGRYQLSLSAFLAVALIVMSRLHSLAAFAVLIPLVALGEAFTYTGGLFHGVAGSTHRAGRTAIHESLLAGGYIVGAFVGGLLYERASFQGALWFCAAWLLAALAAQTAILSRVRRRTLQRILSRRAALPRR